MSNLLKRFRDDIAGATAIEYALIAGFISIMIIGSATAIGNKLIEVFTSVKNGFNATP